MNSVRSACLARAKGYPYKFSNKSFTYRDGNATIFEPKDCQGRKPVLAFGSNQSLERLVQKFKHLKEVVIPVQRGQLRDFDVVYAASIASYGAVPAMLQFCFGVEVSLAVTWLDELQVEVMHATEGLGVGYDFGLIENIDLQLDNGVFLREAYAYVSRRGHLVHDNRAIALEAVSAWNREWPERTTDEVLTIARNRVSPNSTVDDFIMRLVDDDDFRGASTIELERDAIAFSYPYKVVDG